MSDAISGDLKAFSDDELLQQLSALLGQSRRIEWQLVTHIGEVDARRLFAREACESMFVYCTHILHLSEHEAYLRIAAARAAREHPMLLTMLSDGRLHLRGIAKLAPHLTVANREALLAQATHRSKRQIEVLVAELAPRPDVPTAIRKLPARAARVAVEPVAPIAIPSDLGLELGPDRVPVAPAATPLHDVDSRSTRPHVDPLGSGRFKVQFTASAAFCEKLERLKALMLSSVPDGDLAQVLETAVTEALRRREARRFAKTETPRKTVADTDTSASSSRYIPAPVRRVSYASDDGRRAFVSSGGRRCSSFHRVEFHHGVPWARGGDRSPDNIRLMCRNPQRASGRKGLRRGGDGSLPEDPSAARTMTGRRGWRGGGREDQSDWDCEDLDEAPSRVASPSRAVQVPGRGSRENGTFHRGIGPRDGSRIIRSTMPRAWLRVTMAANVVMSGQSGNGTSSAASSPSFAWYRTISPSTASDFSVASLVAVPMTAPILTGQVDF